MSNESRLVNSLNKIPLFTDLPPKYVQLLLNVCEKIQLAAGTQLFRSGTASDELYIILSGEVAITTQEGIQLATIKPIATVGIGIFTGEIRMAAAEITEDSRLLKISKITLDRLLREDKPFASRVYHNCINIISEKLANDNIRLSEGQFKKKHFENRGNIISQQIDAQNQTVELIINDLETKKIMTRSQAEARLDDNWAETAYSILLVDTDVKSSQTLFKSLIDYQVLAASSIAIALEILDQDAPDIVITDLEIATTNGNELLAKLHENYPEIPLLAMSESIESGEIRSHGFDGFIRKPINIASFIRIIEAALT